MIIKIKKLKDGRNRDYKKLLGCSKSEKFKLIFESEVRNNFLIRTFKEVKLPIAAELRGF